MSGEPSPPGPVGDALEARIRADERAIRAKELHDGLGQLLVAASFEAARLVRHAEAGRDTVPLLAQALATHVDEAIALSRRTQVAWRADAPRTGGVGFLREVAALADDVGRRAGVAVRLEVDVDERALAPDVSKAALQCLAAALDNVVRHAGARRAGVVARLAPAGLELVVEDDGRGFDPGRAAGSGAGGFLGMRERTAALGGTIDVSACPGGGTRVRCWVPLPPRPEAPR